MSATIRTVRRALFGATCALWLGLAASPGLAFTPDEPLADPALEARARALHAELRCLVCQGQSIADSNAVAGPGHARHRPRAHCGRRER